MSKKRLTIIIIAAWLAGSVVTPVHTYGNPFASPSIDSPYHGSLNAGFYVQPAWPFASIGYCGLEYYGVPGLFCAEDN